MEFHVERGRFSAEDMATAIGTIPKEFKSQSGAAEAIINSGKRLADVHGCSLTYAVCAIIDVLNPEGEEHADKQRTMATEPPCPPRS
jgi:hypothetical protein